MKFATIIGSRTCTNEELETLRSIAEHLHREGYTLRSGGAVGADSVINTLEHVQIIIPWEGFNGLKHDGMRVFCLRNLKDRNIALKSVQQNHPAPHRLENGALKLHMRNIYQITGPEAVNREKLSELVVFCADEDHRGNVSGGTRTAVTLARRLHIPTYNIRKYDQIKGFIQHTHDDLLKPQIIDRFTKEHSFLSNFYPVHIVYEGISYQSVEAAFQASKCTDYKDKLEFKDLTPVQAKHKGRQVTLPPNWERDRVNIMKKLLELKFEHPELAQKLKDTGAHTALIEGNTWNDTFWGKCNGIGKNMLGKLLMKLRDELLYTNETLYTHLEEQK